MERDYGLIFQDRRRDAKAWNNLQSPGERANHDFARFVDFYFLTDGIPDKTKTPEPLALYELRDRKGLHEFAGRIAGLETKSGGSGEDRALCIGWDRSAVWNLVRQMDMQEHEKKEREQEAKWEASMEAHRDYVADLGSKTSRGPGYDFEDGLGLDMSLGHDGSQEAAYDFGPIEGTMLLDLSEEKVAELAVELDSDGGEDESDEEEEEEEKSQPNPPRK
ncbi:uncharacterized protein IWZ02DRAFT_435929 [Phyllosticta citriasiana]|uniref:Uncharacterized protein n=1 Tax=Phyllosticta citriasiana TaxID=595635 RepID=A0ABR1K8K3_9PEZI